MRPEVEEQIKLWRREFAELSVHDPVPPIRVLVLGPGATASYEDVEMIALQEKRQQIVTGLQEGGLAATTPEDLLDSVEVEIGELPLHHVESKQLESADFVIVLLASPGSIGELAGLIASRRTVARRSAVFYNGETLRGSYLEAGPLQNLVALGVTHPYTVDDAVSCRVRDLAIEYSLDQAVSLRGSGA